MNKFEMIIPKDGLNGHSVEWYYEKGISKGWKAIYVPHPKVLKGQYVKESDYECNEHYHIGFQLPKDVDWTIENIAKAMEVENNSIEKIKKRWIDFLRYILTHVGYPERGTPCIDQVISNFDFKAILDACTENVPRIDLSPIKNGLCRPYNVSQYYDIDTYANHRRQIDNAFSFKEDELRLNGANRNMQVFVINGLSGSGKTTYAKYWCDAQNYSYCVSSSSNDPLQDYKGQDVLILDDFRPWEWNLTDLIKLLDNHTSSSGKSRYSNKCMLYCKVIILTSVLPYSEWWNELKQTNDEQRTQLDRRIIGVMSLTKIESKGSLVGVSMDMFSPQDPDQEHVQVDLSDEFIGLINPSERKVAMLDLVKGTISMKSGTDNGFTDMVLDNPFTVDGLPLLKP